ncbi:MAG TPA: alcohol dehydrogenase catalytic domain-containing protein [Candidatus Acidoferrales bacterium]|jgi:2-desacetyl-2-hydroxyethyl bacteriochlorophyllide A dehydrogenase|nr:alcohol dehydrogenase catalytic domain-containing protein [Candidatus Acidoferrales bacterium]
MKAMVLEGPRKLALNEVERPVPGHNDVLVRVTHSGVCGTDLHIYEGGIPVRHPLIMGHEMIGEVVEGGDAALPTGSRVIVDPAIYCGMCLNCRAGQTNLCPNGSLVGRDSNGGFADYLVAPRTHVYPLPAAIDSNVAPLIQVATTCMHGHHRMNIFPGQSVVVMGLGVAGQIHVELAKSWGAYPVIGITRSAFKRNLAEQLGADTTMSSGAEAVKAVKDSTEGRGADVVIECTGVASALADAINMVRLGGTILLFGISSATQMTLPFYQLYYKELNIVNTRAAKGEDFPPTIDLVARGVLNLKPLVTHIVPLLDLEKAMHMLVSDEDQRMKIIMENPR